MEHISQEIVSLCNYIVPLILIIIIGKTTVTFENADANFWCIGTAGQLMNGENRGGIVNSSSFTAWVPTNNSIQAVHMAPFFHFTAYDSTVESGGDYSYSLGCGEYAINCNYTVTYTGYKTKAEYTAAMTEIKTELESQTTELESQTQELQNQTAELEEQTETQKGIFASIQEFFGSFFDNLVDSVIGLFVPSSEEMNDLLGQFDDFFSETFGFLYYPFEVLTRFVDLVLNSDGTTRFTFPSFSIMGYKVWDNIGFDFYDYGIVNDLFIYVRRGTGVIIVFAFINYLRNFFDKRFGGGGK